MRRLCRTATLLGIIQMGVSWSDATIPQCGAVNTQLAASYALEPHLIARSRIQVDGCFLSEERSYCAWATPFGEYVFQKSQEGNPSFTDQIAGMLVGFDYSDQNYLIGGALGYGFDTIHYGDSAGHARIQDELACVYGSYKTERLWVNAVLWGGLSQLQNRPYHLLNSTARTHGWILSPHVAIAAPLKGQGGIVEPFLMFDWVNHWQERHFSLLRSEIGLCFCETWCLLGGKMVFEEKLSYVNQAPFAIGETRVENLGGVGLRGLFLPKKQAYPYGILDFEGEFNSSYQLYFVSLEIGKDF